MTSADFAPGEMLARIQNNKPVKTLPGDLDIILYLAVIFKALPVEDDQSVTVKNGVLRLSRALRDEGGLYRLAIRDFKADLVFLAILESDHKWNIIRSKLTDKELLLLEHTFDKVRTSMNSIDRFLNEYPPIGIV